jgi:monoamine oxidase
MARTPLIGSIIRLARQCHAAGKPGFPLAKVQQPGEGARHPPGAFTRRRFLAGSLLAMSGLVLPRWAWGRPSKQPKIAIVGAGIAGLNCALSLADKGLRASLYETSSRIGGRMFSNNTGYWSEQQVTEWCGELIILREETSSSPSQ